MLCTYIHSYLNASSICIDFCKIIYSLYSTAFLSLLPEGLVFSLNSSFHIFRKHASYIILTGTLNTIVPYQSTLPALNISTWDIFIARVISISYPNLKSSYKPNNEILPCLLAQKSTHILHVYVKNLHSMQVENINFDFLQSVILILTYSLYLYAYHSEFL